MSAIRIKTKSNWEIQLTQIVTNLISTFDIFQIEAHAKWV